MIGLFEHADWYVFVFNGEPFFASCTARSNSNMRKQIKTIFA